MNDFDNALILPEREFIALAALRGVKRLVGLFAEDPEGFSDAEFTELLFSLARKNFVDITPSSVAVCPQVGEAIDVFRENPETVVLSPYAQDKAQLCLTCAEGKIVCTSRISGSAGRIRLCMVTPARLVQYFAEDGYLDDIPETSLNSEPFVRENTENTNLIFRVEKISADGDRQEWMADFTSDGCYLTDPSGSTVACCRQQMSELILSLTAS